MVWREVFCFFLYVQCLFRFIAAPAPQINVSFTQISKLKRCIICIIPHLIVSLSRNTVEIMRYKCFLIAILVMLAMRLTGQTRGEEVFTTPTVEAIPYRIPAITTLRDGRLLTIADYRHCRSDIGYGRIDLHLRDSEDGGRTWGTILKPFEMQGDGDLTPGHQKAGYGDPCIVADRRSGRVLVISCSGGPLFSRGSRAHHQGMARFWSEDGGKTWTEPE